MLSIDCFWSLLHKNSNSKIYFSEGKMSLNDIITLDVGGEIFRTSRATLVKFPESKLARHVYINSINSPSPS